MGMTDDPGPPVDVKNLWIIRGKRSAPGVRKGGWSSAELATAQDLAKTESQWTILYPIEQLQAVLNTAASAPPAKRLKQ